MEHIIPLDLLIFEIAQAHCLQIMHLCTQQKLENQPLP